MSTRRYTITDAIEHVALALRDGTDHSPTTIRCALNDTLDAAGKSGWIVRHDYDQLRAVRRVQAALDASRVPATRRNAP